MKYPLLDPLRGVAALWVFFFHYHFSSAFKLSCEALLPFLAVGHLGVPMFFVISGYCITASARSCLRREESVRGFLSRRMVRILPPFWCSVVVVATVPFLIEGLSCLKTGQYEMPNSGHPNLRYIGFGPFEWIQMLTLTQVFVPDPTATTLQQKFTGLNAVYWTLAIEVQFYMVVAVAVVARQRFYLVMAAVTLLSVPFALTPASELIGIFLPYWPQFALGCMLFCALESGWTVARVCGRWTRLVARTITAAAGAALAGCVLTGVPIEITAFAGGFTLVLWANKLPDAGTVLPTENRRVMRWLTAVCGFLGLISYSLYLLHGRIQFLVQAVTRQVVPANSIAFDLAVIAGTCLLTYVFYVVCEAPFLRLSQRSGRVALRKPDSASAFQPLDRLKGDGEFEMATVKSR